MEKKFYFLFFITFVVFIIGGIFLWSEYSKEIGNITPAVKFEPPENYVIKDTSKGKIVENKKAGISFKVPEGWKVEKKEIGIDEWVINILSPDARVNDSGLLIKGCGVGVHVEHHRATANATRYRIKDPERFSKEISGDYQAIEIDKHPALKMTIRNSGWGEAVAIKLPIEDKIYMFDTRFLPEETERCSQAFEEFLKGVSID